MSSIEIWMETDVTTALVSYGWNLFRTRYVFLTLPNIKK